MRERLEIMKFESVGGLARRAGFSTKTIYRAIARGELEAYRVSGSTRISRESADAWLTATPVARRIRDRKPGAA